MRDNRPSSQVICLLSDWSVYFRSIPSHELDSLEIFLRAASRIDAPFGLKKERSFEWLAEGKWIVGVSLALFTPADKSC